MSVSDQVRIIINELHNYLEQAYGPRLNQVILYGSQARGDAEEGSDIDVLVVLNDRVDAGDEIAKTSKTISRLSLKYDTLVSCTFVSRDRFTKEQSPLFLNVRREGIAA
ncbi:MAG: nucleotidyltransferase domain-containing protein [Candidatus Omnitrophica bacterium]|nr:nucleotidyltransferase domain-containing protein [Candidatus Omnitrophota bacterium]